MLFKVFWYEIRFIYIYCTEFSLYIFGPLCGFTYQAFTARLRCYAYHDSIIYLRIIMCYHKKKASFYVVNESTGVFKLYMSKYSNKFYSCIVSILQNKILVKLIWLPVHIGNMAKHFNLSFNLTLYINKNRRNTHVYRCRYSS